jgi:Na+-driven multidrug efflux pump
MSGSFLPFTVLSICKNQFPGTHALHLHVFAIFDMYVMHAGVGNLVNAILDAILVFPLGLGVRGAALATVTSEYVKATMRI